MEEHATGASCKTLSREDFPGICRFCLSSDPLDNIFELMFKEQTPLVDALYRLFGRQLDPKDDLPKRICETCIGEVIRCYDFKKRYEASEATLLNIIAIKTEPEEIEIKTEPLKCYLEEVRGPLQTEQVTTDLKKSPTCNPEQTVIVTKRKQSGKFTCSCEEIFTSRLEFRQHRDLTNHQIPRNCPCKICGKFFTRSALWRHSRTHDDVKRYSCIYCTMRFSSGGNLQRHLKIHTGEKPHLCEFCGKSFNQSDTLKAHRRIHTGETPYVCALCGKRFKKKLMYNWHIRNHSRQKCSNLNPTDNNTKKTIVCGECGRSCYGQGAYKLHLNKHGLATEQIVEDDPCQCEICKKFYASPSSLSFHMLTHNKEKRFLCNVCGKRFHKKATLESHTLVHSGERSFACEFCDKKFARQISLQKHQNVHTGERPYACALCPNKFKQSTHLTNHMMVHNGERPHVCTVCKKSFRHKYPLDLHMRIHTGEKPFKCDLCTNMFYDAGTLKKHKQRKHQV